MDIDPCSRVYNQGCLRQELIASIETGVMKPFSSRNQKRKWRAGKITHVPVYCKCREVEEGLMIECEGCSEWFHQKCCSVPDEYFSKTEDLQWTCMECHEKYIIHTFSFLMLCTVFVVLMRFTVNSP